MSAPWRARDRAAAVRASAWKRSQPPKSSMISLYFVSERFSKAVPGSLRPSQRVGEEAAGDGAVAEELDSALGAERGEAVLGAVVEQRILHLHARRAARRHRGAPASAACRNWCRRYGRSCPRAASPSATRAASTAAGDVVVPPVELDEVEALLPEPAQRALDDAADVGRVDPAKIAPGPARTWCAP